VVLIGHSLGSLAAAGAISGGGKVAAAFLVAPPDPHSQAFAQVSIDPAFKEKAPQAALKVPGVIVASRTDPFAEWNYAEGLARQWGLELADAGDAGHINAESGHGPWPEGLMRLAGLFNKI
jgi:predicted alpha/beta hydrolase family esterase